MTAVRRLRPVLKLQRKRTKSVLDRASAVHAGMEKDPKVYSSPNPALSVLKDQMGALVDAEGQVKSRAPGASAARNVQRQALVAMLETECSYVQTLCDQNPAQAAVLIEGAGMVVGAFATRSTLPLEVTSEQPGTAALVASPKAHVGKSRKRACWNWQWTTDGGQTFHDAPSTPSGETTISGLPPLSMVGFRVCVSTRGNKGEWSAVVTIRIQ